MIIAIMMIVAIAEILVVNIASHIRQDKSVGWLAGGCFDLLVGIIMRAVVTFDMQLIQVSESYYIEDVVRKDGGFSGRAGEFIGFEMSSHGVDFFVLNIAGAVFIAVGVVMIVFAFYNCMQNRKITEQTKKNNVLEKKAEEISVAPSHTPASAVGQAIPAWKRIEIEKQSRSAECKMCPACGAEQNDTANKFCYKCGHNFG